MNLDFTPLMQLFGLLALVLFMLCFLFGCIEREPVISRILGFIMLFDIVIMVIYFFVYNAIVNTEIANYHLTENGKAFLAFFTFFILLVGTVYLISKKYFKD